MKSNAMTQFSLQLKKSDAMFRLSNQMLTYPSKEDGGNGVVMLDLVLGETAMKSGSPS